MVSSSNTLLEVGVDYLTVTADGGARGALVEARVMALYRDELRAGNFVRPWGMAGYTGFRVGQVEYGTRHDGCVARLRGKLAADHWPKFFAAADNCSRIDEQITVRAGGGARALLRNEYRRALRRHHTNAAAGEVDYRQSTDGGATLYLGKRVSGRFGRVYDKGVQSKLDHYEGAVRYELELKGQLAFAEASRLAASRSRERAIADSLIAFFEVDRGLNGLLRAGLEPNQPIGCLIPYAGLTDHNRSLSWLATCVRPTVQKLIRAGKLDAVLDALGLDNQARGSNGPQKTRPADQWPNRR